MCIWTCGPEDGDRLGRPRDNSDPGKINVPEGASVAQIAIGWKHGHFFTDTNQFYSWGTGDSWRLGTGEQVNLPTPTKVNTFPPNIKFKQIACGDKFSAATTQTGELYVWGSGYAHIPTQLELPQPAEYIACGQIWLLAALADGTVMQFYRHVNPTQQTFGEDRIISVACGQNHRLALADNGHVYSWGSGAATGQGVAGTPTIIPELQNVMIQAIFAYHNSSYFIDNDNHVWCCGTNASNCLGIGHSEEVPVPTRMNFDFNNEQIVQIACGDDFTLFLSAQGNVWASGNGGDFRNATGSVETRPIPTLAIKLQGKFITQIAAGCFNTAVLENGYPPFNRMARFRGIFSDFVIPVLPFRATMANMASVEINPSDEVLRPLGFMTKDIILLENDKQAMIVGAAQGKPAVICQGANEIALIEPDIIKYPIKSRPGIQMFYGEDENGNKIAVDPSEKETLRIGGFLFGDEIDDGSVVVGARCDCIWTSKNNIISKRDHSTLNIKSRKNFKIIQKTTSNGERYVLNSLGDLKIIVFHDSFGVGYLYGTVGKRYCYEFLFNGECIMLDQELKTVRIDGIEKCVEYLTEDYQKINVNIETDENKRFIPLDRVLVENKYYGTVVGYYNDKIVIRSDLQHINYGLVLPLEENQLKLVGRVFHKGRSQYKFNGSDILLNVNAKKAQKLFPNDRVEIDGKRGYIAGKLKGKYYVLFDNKDEVDVIEENDMDKLILIRRSIDVAGYQKYENTSVDVSLMDFAMALIKPGDKRMHDNVIYVCLGYDEDDEMNFQNTVDKSVCSLTPSQLDIEYFEVDN